MKKITLLLAMPVWLLTACSQDKKPDTGQTEPLTEQAEGGDPHVRPQEYEHGTHDDRADTVPPVKADTMKTD
jgi:hypothetical protein